MMMNNKHKKMGMKICEVVNILLGEVKWDIWYQEVTHFQVLMPNLLGICGIMDILLM